MPVACSQGFPDIWLFLWRCLPVGVSAAENMRFPVMGDVRSPFAPAMRRDVRPLRVTYAVDVALCICAADDVAANHLRGPRGQGQRLQSRRYDCARPKYGMCFGACGRAGRFRFRRSLFCGQPQNAIGRDNRWPHIVVYPEGNTCNGRQICGFKARRLRCFFAMPVRDP